LVSRSPVQIARPVETVLSRLQNVRATGSGWSARCPAHDDTRSSLAIDEGTDGRCLLKCFVGCTVPEIVAKLDLTMADLFTAKHAHRPAHREGRGIIPMHTTATMQPSEEPPGCTLAAYAAEKQLPVPFLEGLGLADMWYIGKPAIRIAYRDIAGEEVTARFRTALHKTDGADERFKWRKGARLGLYGLWRLAAAREAGYAVLVEGESDCHTLWYHQEPALGVPGANTWKDAWAADLDGIPIIYAVIEPGDGGDHFREALSRSPLRERLRFISLEGAKDPSELYTRDPAHFSEQWPAALEASVPWSVLAQAEAQARTAVAWAECRELAEQPDILACFADTLTRQGVAGERRAAQLVYLAAVSRLLNQPISIAVKGPSSSGKSYIVERGLRFFPEHTYYALSAMSEHALAYSEEPLSHRMLVIYEAAGLRGDFASYLMRSLLSEGRVRYETVEKTRDGLRPRLIEREGPTGLIVTTTAAHLHPENETRLLSIPMNDTQEQTRDILRALAQENTSDEVEQYTAWHALQTWLENAEHRVSIPYAPALAEQIPPLAVRLRRDFPLLKNLIKSHALLHQATRPRDGQGRIIATLADYAAVRALVADLLAEGIEATVSATIRETVEAVQAINSKTHAPVTVAQVARRLNLDKSAALRRVEVCRQRGYLQNLEKARGRPAQLMLGDALPGDTEILPSPEALAEYEVTAAGCTVAERTEGIEQPPTPAPDAEVRGFLSPVGPRPTEACPRCGDQGWIASDLTGGWVCASCTTDEGE
jgi:hypothetical protein